jgi:Membrane protein involved in the export of O-antigen and teichoic acid
VSNFLFPLITFPYVSRVLLPEGTGKVAFALSIVSYFTLFASFGVATYGIRAIAQVRDDKDRLSKTMHELLFINIISMIIVYIALVIAISVVPKFAMEKELFWVTSLFVLFTIIGIEWLYKGLEKYQYITIRTIVFKIASLFLVFLFVKEKSDYIIFAFISIFAIVGSGVLNLINSRKLINYILYSEYEFKKHLKPMFVLFLTSMAIAIYTSLDEGLLGLLSSPEQVGYYNAAVRVKGILFTLITSLGVVLLPRLSYYVENHMETEFHEALAKSTNFIIVIAASVVIFFTLFAKETILILAGENYVASIIPLQIVVWALILSAITNILGIQILLPLKKDKQLLFSVLCAATVDVIANFLLVPKLAAVGTALSVIAAELSVLIVQIIILRQYIKILFSGLQLHKIIIALLIAIACALFVREIVINTSTLIIFLCSSSVFFLAYFIILLLLKEKFIMYVYHTIYTKFIAYRR